MKACPWDFLRDRKKHIISLVGGGGKTTIMYELAAYYAALGHRVVATTTTHIWQPALSLAALKQGEQPQQPVFARDIADLKQLWQLGRFGVIGTPEAGSGKLVAPLDNFMQEAMAVSEIMLVEADGSKQLPCKLPKQTEPVLLPESDIVIAVVGLDAMDKSLEEACFRWQLGKELFASSCNLLIDELKLAAILTGEQGSRKGVGQRDYYIALNKCDLVEPARVDSLVSLLMERGIPKNKLWVRGIV